MIEKLLLRIAKRASQSTSTLPSELTPASAANRSRFEPSLPFPARSRVENSPAAPWSDSDSLWVAACQAGATPIAAGAVPPAFSQFNRAFAEVGEVIWDERARIGTRLIHVIEPGGQVVAAVYPKRRKILIRKSIPHRRGTTLTLRELPSIAQEFDASIAAEFHETTPHMLFWYCGQAEPDAVKHVPAHLVAGRMILRTLPLVDPRSLKLRHLRLIQIFSAGVLTFADLMAQLDAEGRKFICADIASLYMSSSLVSADD